jgi:hypothetical protein
MFFSCDHIKQLLAEGVTEESLSTQSSHVFLEPKGPNNFSALMDYRLLNQRFEVESTPLPDTHSAFSWFGQDRCFSTFYLYQAYNQIPLARSSRRLTAFSSEWNLYQCSRAPFGLATGSQIPILLIDRMFHDIKFAYLNY